MADIQPAFIPPELPPAVRLLAISDQPLSVDEVLGAVADASAGGVAMFVGVVRDHDGGRSQRVVSLGYEAHPGALAALAEVATEVVGSHQVIALAGVHRVGLLAVGDLALVAAVACVHRGDAFSAAQKFVDEVKARVPIWKRQTFADGEIEWVGIGTDPT